MFVCYCVRMQCTLGNCERSRNPFSSYNPELGPRLLSIDKYNIDVAHIQHCSQYNTSYHDYKYIYDMLTSNDDNNCGYIHCNVRRSNCRYKMYTYN